MLMRRSSFSLHASISRTFRKNIQARYISVNHPNLMSNTVNDPLGGKFQLAKPYQGLERNVWVEFIELALKHKPLNLGQGFPDDLVPAYLPETVSQTASDNPVNNQYTRGFGHPRLISALSKMYTPLLGREANPIQATSEILVTVGAYEALFTAITSLVNAGDEVLIIEPYFDCYEPMVKLAGGIPKFVALSPKKKADSSTISTSADWTLNFEELSSKFSAKTKLLIFNNPNNPLGKVYTREEMTQIAELCKKHNVVVISDEVYEHMIFDSNEFIRMANLNSDMWNRTITLGSAGKTFSVTGWKLGWAIGPQSLIKCCQVAHQNSLYTCPTLIQEAVARAFEYEMSISNSPECYFNSISTDLQKKRDCIVKMLREADLEPVIPQGGYFILADWSKYANKIDLNEGFDTQTDNEGDASDYKFVKWMSRIRGLQGIPPSAFFSKDHKQIASSYIRFCFIKKQESLEKANVILQKLKSDYKNQ